MIIRKSQRYHIIHGQGRIVVQITLLSCNLILNLYLLSSISPPPSQKDSWYLLTLSDWNLEKKHLLVYMRIIKVETSFLIFWLLRFSSYEKQAINESDSRIKAFSSTLRFRQKWKKINWKIALSSKVDLFRKL